MAFSLMNSFNNDAWQLIREIWPAPSQGDEKIHVLWPEPSDALFEILETLGPKRVEIFQSFKPFVDAFASRGFPVNPNLALLSGTTLFVPTRQRVESLEFIARALLNLSPLGEFVFACANGQGASGFVRRLREIAPDLDSQSGNKCKAVVLRKENLSKDSTQVLRDWIQSAAPCTLESKGIHFSSRPGIFGWNKIDRGSELLIESLPNLEGLGADLGAGYGYLSVCALKKQPELRIHLMEAEWRALECAQLNARGAACEFHWVDVSQRSSLSQIPELDWVMMNPPFHEGRQTEVGLGQSFIENASFILKPRGSLYLVANEFLPYENILQSHFEKVRTLSKRDGFKVMHAQK